MKWDLGKRKPVFGFRKMKSKNGIYENKNPGIES